MPIVNCTADELAEMSADPMPICRWWIAVGSGNRDVVHLDCPYTLSECMSE